MNPRIKVERNEDGPCLASGYGRTRLWSCFVDGNYVGIAKNKAEAVQIGEAHIRNMAEDAAAEIERDHLEFDQ